MYRFLNKNCKVTIQHLDGARLVSFREDCLFLRELECWRTSFEIKEYVGLKDTAMRYGPLVMVRSLLFEICRVGFGESINYLALRGWLLPREGGKRHLE